LIELDEYGLLVIGYKSWAMGQGVGGRSLQLGGWRLEVRGGRWEELTVVPGSIHINSPVRFLFHVFIFHVSCFIFQKYIRHQQRGFHQEDV
jgi:hypothetical protein